MKKYSIDLETPIDTSFVRYYTKHIFLCTNQKITGKTCCANTGGELFLNYFKVKVLELSGLGKIKISQSGCLGRCSVGPCIVIYPEGVWYRYNSTADIDKIIDKHLINNQLVDELVIVE